MIKNSSNSHTRLIVGKISTQWRNDALFVRMIFSWRNIPELMSSRLTYHRLKITMRIARFDMRRTDQRKPSKNDEKQSKPLNVSAKLLHHRWQTSGKKLRQILGSILGTRQWLPHRPLFFSGSVTSSLRAGQYREADSLGSLFFPLHREPF